MKLLPREKALFYGLAFLGLLFFSAGWNAHKLATPAAQEAPQITTDTIERFRPIIKQEMDKRFDSPNPMPNIQGQSKTRLRHVAAVNWDKSDRGGNWTERIDRYLEGSPLAGQGRTYMLAALDEADREKEKWLALNFEFEPRLMPSIAGRESNKGRIIPHNSFNAVGMTAGTAPLYGVVYATGPDGRRPYQAFPSWDVMIWEQKRFIKRHWGSVWSPFEMRGYAMDPAWKPGVANEMNKI